MGLWRDGLGKAAAIDAADIQTRYTKIRIRLAPRATTGGATRFARFPLADRP